MQDELLLNHGNTSRLSKCIFFRIQRRTHTWSNPSNWLTFFFFYLFASHYYWWFPVNANNCLKWIPPLHSPPFPPHPRALCSDHIALQLSLAEQLIKWAIKGKAVGLRSWRRWFRGARASLQYYLSRCQCNLESWFVKHHLFKKTSASFCSWHGESVQPAQPQLLDI